MLNLNNISKLDRARGSLFLGPEIVEGAIRPIYFQYQGKIYELIFTPRQHRTLTQSKMENFTSNLPVILKGYLIDMNLNRILVEEIVTDIGQEYFV